MRFWTTGLGLCATAVLAPLSAAAQTPPPASPITRTVIAATKLPSVVEAPLHFKALRVTIAPGEKSSVSAANGIVYQLSGLTEVSLAGVVSPCWKDGGADGGKRRAIDISPLPPCRGGGPRPDGRDGARKRDGTLSHRCAHSRPQGRQLRSKSDAGDLSGAHASNPPHHRSGAALYFIISGTGANTVGGTTVAKGPGSLIYEPFGLVHQWGNPGDEPLTFLAFNLNPEGVAAVVPGAPAKTQ
jgi:mannose-6-phosphate isomerase-like protein (cupin superfamily)